MFSRVNGVLRKINSGPSIWGSIELFANPLLNLVLVPILFNAYGADGYGGWVYAASTAALGTLGGLGVAGVSTWLVARARIDENGETFSSVLRKIHILTIISFVTGGCLISLFILITTTMKVPQPASFSQLFVLVPPLYCAQQFDAVMSGVLRGLDKYRELALVEVSGKVIACVAIWVISLNNFGIEIGLAAFGLVCILNAMGKLVVANFNCRTECWREQPLDYSQLKSLFNEAKWFWLQGISSVVFSSVDRLIIGSFLGPKLLGTYAIATQIGSVALLFFSGVFQRLVTAAKRVHTKGDGVAARLFFRKVLTINVIMSIFTTAIVLMSVDFAIALWLGNKSIELPFVNIRYLLLPFLLLTGTVAAHYSLTGFGIFKPVGFLNIVSGSVMLLALVPLVSYFGLRGAAVARGLYAVLFYYEWVLFYLAVKKDLQPCR